MGNRDRNKISCVSMKVAPENTSWPWEHILTMYFLFVLSIHCCWILTSKTPLGKHSSCTVVFYFSNLIFWLMSREKSTSVYWSASWGKQREAMLHSLWSNRINDMDAMPRKGVAAFNTLQIELIDLLSKSYDGAILNLGMKPEFLPINSPFSSPDQAVSKFLFSDDNQFKWGNSCQTQCSNYIVRKDW